MSSPEKKMQNRRSFFKKRKEKENRASDHVSEAASPNGFPVLSLFLRCTRMRVEMSSRFSRQRLASQRRLQERERERVCTASRLQETTVDHQRLPSLTHLESSM